MGGRQGPMENLEIGTPVNRNFRNKQKVFINQTGY